MLALRLLNEASDTLCALLIVVRCDAQSLLRLVRNPKCLIQLPAESALQASLWWLECGDCPRRLSFRVRGGDRTERTWLVFQHNMVSTDGKQLTTKALCENNKANSTSSGDTIGEQQVVPAL